MINSIRYVKNHSQYTAMITCKIEHAAPCYVFKWGGFLGWWIFRIVALSSSGISWGIQWITRIFGKFSQITFCKFNYQYAVRYCPMNNKSNLFDLADNTHPAGTRTCLIGLPVRPFGDKWCNEKRLRKVIYVICWRDKEPALKWARIYPDNFSTNPLSSCSSEQMYLVNNMVPNVQFTLLKVLTGLKMFIRV